MHALVCIIVISWHGAIFCEYVDLNFGHQPLKKTFGTTECEISYQHPEGGVTVNLPKPIQSLAIWKTGSGFLPL